MTKAVHVEIRGVVQGVGYREWCRQTASSLGLSGWVRNRRSGTVEAVFSGAEGAIDEMLAAMRKGPAGSRVDEVELIGPAGPMAGGFEIRPTA